MNAPALHPHEADRFLSVCGLRILSDGRSPIFDLAARQAAALCETPAGLVTLIGEREQAFLGASGTTPFGASRDTAFCAHTILQGEAMVVEDARSDPQFADNPFVVGEPHLRFYAGVPFLDRSGLPLGTVCVIDTQPRTPSTRGLLILHRLASLVGIVLEARRAMVDALDGADVRAAAASLERALEPLFGPANGFPAEPA